jgi:hypothetical protein
LLGCGYTFFKQLHAALPHLAECLQQRANDFVEECSLHELLSKLTIATVCSCERAVTEELAMVIILAPVASARACGKVAWAA